MPFSEIVAPTKTELFVNHILHMILSEELKPGDQLPTERELAATTKMSKTLVHEGIRELTRLGFLDVMSRKGVVVANYAENGNIDTLIAIMNYQSGNLDPRTAISLLDVRYYLEAPVIRELAEHPDPQKIQKLEQLCEDAKAASERSKAAFMEAVMDYHHQLLLMGSNALIPIIYNAFRPASLGFWNGYLNDLGTEQTLEALETYPRLIREGKADELDAFLKAGIETFKTHYQK